MLLAAAVMLKRVVFRWASNLACLMVVEVLQLAADHEVAGHWTRSHPPPPEVRRSI